MLCVEAEREALLCGVYGQGGDPAVGGLPVRGEGAPGWGAGRAGRDARSKCNDFFQFGWLNRVSAKS